MIGYEALSLCVHPLSRIAPHLHPRAVGVDIFVAPAHLYVAENALGMGHEGCEAAIFCGDCGKAIGAAVGVGGILLCGCALVVCEAHRGDDFAGIAPSAVRRVEIGEAFAVGDGYRQARAFHASEEEAG